MKLWLLYSQINRPLPLLAPWLGRQLHEDSNGVGKALPVLKSKGFIELCEKDASIALAPCKQSAILETETETETDNKVHSTPSASNGKSADDPFFDQFWQAFPRQRRGSKGKALAAWKTAVKRAMPDAILSGLKTYAASEEVARGYAKGAAAWLNDDRWASEYKPAGQGRLGPDGKPREVYLV